MAPLDLLDHLLNFVAPAVVVGFVCAVLARLSLRRGPRATAWWTQGCVNAAAGIAVLLAGLVVFGRDGKMATYAALVLACATSQWLLAGGLRR